MRRISFLLIAILLFASVSSVRVNAEERDTFIYDEASVLTDSQMIDLSAIAKQVSEKYNCGVYVAVFANMKDYGFSNIEQFSEAVFSSWDLGFGAEDNGIVLVLSMAGRDYDIDAHGSIANTAFTDYGKEQLAIQFVDDFRSNQWYSGFCDYINYCGTMLEVARTGSPIDIETYQSQPVSLESKMLDSLFPGIIIGVIIAFFRGSSLKKKMKSVFAASEASEYLDRNRFQLTFQDDSFTHTTVVRQRIERESGTRNGHGGTSVNSGGHSHSSGKF